MFRVTGTTYHLRIIKAFASFDPTMKLNFQYVSGGIQSGYDDWQLCGGV